MIGTVTVFTDSPGANVSVPAVETKSVPAPALPVEYCIVTGWLERKSSFTVNVIGRVPPAPSVPGADPDIVMSGTGVTGAAATENGPWPTSFTAATWNRYVTP